MVQALYGPQVKAMVRVVSGVPVSWDPSIASIRFPDQIGPIAWSPCSRFIAAAYYGSPEIVILDAATLKQLFTMDPLEKGISWSNIIFSSQGHLLAACSFLDNCIASWDLQTGGLLSKTSTGTSNFCLSMSYSRCETMIGCSFDDKVIRIFDVFYGTCISSHPTKHPVKAIWTCGEYLQFATVESGSITIMQLSFTLSHPPTQVGSLSTPDNFSSEELVLLPTLSRFSFILHGEILVWDAQHNKFLLHSTNVEHPKDMSFSSDGHFFACGTWDRDFHIWKESPIGYVSHQKLTAGAIVTIPLVSPNGESVISPSYAVLQLWHTANSPTHLPNPSKQAPKDSEWFFVEFSPDESLVAVAEKSSKTVTILDIKSGHPWLVIDADTEICGLRMTGDKTIIVGDGRIVTWDLPARDCTFNTRRDIRNCVQITTFRCSGDPYDLHASISPNLRYMAFWNGGDDSEPLCLYNTHTGEILVTTTSSNALVGFTPSGHEVWCAHMDGRVDKWKVVEEIGSNTIKLEKLESYMTSPSGLPWNSPDGCQDTDNGWILGSNKNWLLCLPPHLQSNVKTQKKWSRKLLAVWNGNSLEPCIFELEV